MIIINIAVDLPSGSSSRKSISSSLSSATASSRRSSSSASEISAITTCLLVLGSGLVPVTAIRSSYFSPAAGAVVVIAGMSSSAMSYLSFPSLVFDLATIFPKKRSLSAFKSVLHPKFFKCRMVRNKSV